MKMKKLLSGALALALTLSLAACGGSGNSSSQAPSGGQSSSEPAPAEKVEMRVAALKGPTAMGMVKLMEDAEAGATANDYTFTLAGAPDELVGKVVQGELDVVAVPTNLAATLYNRTEGKVKLAALNTLSVLYIVENGETVQSVEDLRGKTIYASGKGSTPEFALDYILRENGLVVGTDVQVEYRTEHAEIASLLGAGQAEVAMLPQPFVTSVLGQNDKLRVALDMTAEWQKVDAGSELAMGGVLVQQKFLDEHPEAFAAFMEEYQGSVAYVTAPENLEAAAALIEKQDILKAAVAAKALPACNIVFVTGEEMAQKTAGFLSVLFEANPTSVGGKLPNEDFYYKGN